MTKKNTRKKLMLLDGNAIIHRAFHGVPPLSLPDGTPTNAVYGFTSTLLTVLEKFQPDYVVATFDLPGKTFRHDLFPEYKGKRKELDPDLVPQFDLVKEVVRAMNITIAEKKSYEADDVIGTLSVQATAEDVDTVIVTGDKDTLQLVNDHVSVFTMSRGIHDMILYDEELVLEKMGVRVDQVVDYKGIRGDSSDNIPGVKGIGEKGATELLSLYGDLDGVYAHIDEVKGAMQKKLIADKGKAYLSKELGTIDLKVPVTLSLADSESSAIALDEARGVFAKYQFTSLVKRLDKKKKSEEGEDSDVKVKKQKKESESFRTLGAVEAREFFGTAEGKEVVVVFDMEGDKLHGCAFSVVHSARCVYIPFTDELRDIYEKFLAGGRSKLIAYDMKALWHSSVKAGMSEPVFWRDLLLLAYSARTGKKVDLEHLIFDITGQEYVAQGDTQQMSLSLRDDVSAQRVSAVQVQQMQEVYIKLCEEMDTIAAEQEESGAKTVWHVFDALEMPLAQILYKMEVAGVAFDADVFTSIATKTDKLLEGLTADIYKLAGSEFNINSTKQLRVVLFEDMGISTSGIKKTKTGYSTASSELEKLREEHPIAAKIESYRELFKLKTTYIDTLPKLADQEGRIHTTYNQAVTSTGRLSSSDPNLQNIPIRSEAGRALREAFVASSGKVFISADYSQVDLRCVAHVAEDKAMIDAFNRGVDIHTFTSARVLGKEIADVTKEERSRAKELNFGLIYGMGSFSFAKAADLSHEEAKEFIAKYFSTFEGVKKYMDETKIAAGENGFVETLEGRRYYVNGINAKNAMIKSGAERAAINMPIQGLTAEIMKLAMIAVDAYIQEKYPDGDVSMLLQIHDEIILEVPEKVSERAAEEVKAVMEGVYNLSVPLVADAEIGRHWGKL